MGMINIYDVIYFFLYPGGDDNFAHVIEIKPTIIVLSTLYMSRAKHFVMTVYMILFY